MIVEEIDAKEVLEAVENGAQFIDVREPYEIDEVAYDIPGQLQIPLGQIQVRLSEVPTDKPIIVGCKSGARSMNACQFLLMQGFNEVKNLSGGIMGWHGNGHPTK